MQLRPSKFDQVIMSINNIMFDPVNEYYHNCSVYLVLTDFMRYLFTYKTDFISTVIGN